MAGSGGENKPVEELLSTVRHDVRNQLSNIQLALEQLKYEVTDPTEDYLFYVDTIAISCNKINAIMKSLE